MNSNIIIIGLLITSNQMTCSEPKPPTYTSFLEFLNQRRAQDPEKFKLEYGESVIELLKRTELIKQKFNKNNKDKK